MRYAVYVVIVAAAALVGAATFDRSDRDPASQRPPTTITIAVRSLAEPAATTLAAAWTAPAHTTPASTRPSGDPSTTEAIIVDASFPPAASVTASTAPAELVDDDAQATPLTPGDLATQFTLAALNDRYDTPLDDRRLTLAAWATTDVSAQWAERMTDAERTVDTVRSASATTVSVTQVDDTTWAATVTAAVTESNADGPTTVIDHHLELSLATVPDGLRVTAAAELVGP